MVRHRYLRILGCVLPALLLLAPGADAQSGPPVTKAAPTLEGTPGPAPAAGGASGLGERLGPWAKRGNDGVGGIEKSPGNGSLPPKPAVPNSTAAPTLSGPPDIETGPWTNLGQALPGSAGEPVLVGAGDGTPGSLVAVTLDDGRPGAVAMFILGTQQLDVGFKGGVLVPQPQVVILGLPIDDAGHFVAAASLPDQPLGGMALLMQMWIADSGAKQGFAASNALRLQLP